MGNSRGACQVMFTRELRFKSLVSSVGCLYGSCEATYYYVIDPFCCARKVVIRVEHGSRKRSAERSGLVQTRHLLGNAKRPLTHIYDCRFARIRLPIGFGNLDPSQVEVDAVVHLWRVKVDI